MSPAFCPHCQLLVTDEAGGAWPVEAERCPHCRLLIGTGRALAEPAGEPGARGSAAGVFAGQARRENGNVHVSSAEVRRAIREVASGLGTPPERLMMVDYQQEVAVRDGELPSLNAVFAAYGSWKKARQRAGESV